MVVKELSDIVDFVIKNKETVIPLAVIGTTVVGASGALILSAYSDVRRVRKENEKAKQIVAEYLGIDKSSLRPDIYLPHLLNTAISLSDNCYLAKNYKAEWEEYIDSYNKSKDIKSALKVFLNKPRLRDHILN